jgi:hypothetical protein
VQAVGAEEGEQPASGGCNRDGVAIHHKIEPAQRAQLPSQRRPCHGRLQAALGGSL